MTTRERGLVLLAAGIAAAALFLVTLRRPPQAPPERRPPQRTAVARPATLPAPSSRNIFEYEAAPAVPATRTAAPVVPTMEPEVPIITPPAAPPVRLLGLMRRGGTVKAALSFHGETVLLGVGEEEGGYRVTAVDDEGVRLRAPDGTTLTLPAQ